jgi:hypothetical protein
MKMTLNLADPEESLITEFDSRDRRAFERFGYKALGLSGSLEDAVRRVPDSYVGWLCWHSLKRQQLTTLSYDEFDSRLVELQTEDGSTDDESNPTDVAI